MAKTQSPKRKHPFRDDGKGDSHHLLALAKATVNREFARRERERELVQPAVSPEKVA